jgi:hypothetical protein
MQLFLYWFDGNNLKRYSFAKNNNSSSSLSVKLSFSDLPYIFSKYTVDSSINILVITLAPPLLPLP